MRSIWSIVMRERGSPASHSFTGIGPETERAVENGLLWLARHQDIDGGWNGSTYSEHCEPARCEDMGGEIILQVEHTDQLGLFQQRHAEHRMGVPLTHIRIGGKRMPG